MSTIIFKYEAVVDSIPAMHADLKERLSRYKGVTPKDIIRVELFVEETAVLLLDTKPVCDKERRLKMSVIKRLNELLVRISLDGEPFDPVSWLSASDDDRENGVWVSRLLLKGVAEKLNYSRTNNENVVTITVQRTKSNVLFHILAAMLLGLAMGVAMFEIGETPFTFGLKEYLLSPVNSLFLNALKLIVAPVIFFSLTSCISDFQDLSQLGRIGSRLLRYFVLTIFIATFLGIGTYYVFRPSPGGLLPIYTDDVSTAQPASILDTLVSIVPSDIVTPFLSVNMMQIVFLAAFAGICMACLGERVTALKKLVDALYTLSMQMMKYIIVGMPICTFCSMAISISGVGISGVIPLLALIGTMFAGMLAMVGVYCLLILLFARENPVTFMKKYMPSAITSFSLSSSSATVPVTLEVCRGMGISSRLCSLSIPLCAAINMEGSAIYLTITSLFIASIYGVALDASKLIMLVIMTVSICFCAPSVPSAGLVCLATVLAQIGLPAQAIGIIIGVDRILSGMRASVNCIGDGTLTLITAKKENMLDIKKYRSRGGEIKA